MTMVSGARSASSNHQPLDQGPAGAVGDLGTVESTIARTTLALETQLERSAQARRAAERFQRMAEKRRIESMREANFRERWAAIAGGVTQGVSGGVRLVTAGTPAESPEGRENEGWTAMGVAVGNFSAKCVGLAAEDEKARGAELEHLAEHHGSDVEALRAGEDRLERLIDRAATHLDQVAQARLDARLSSAR